MTESLTAPEPTPHVVSRQPARRPGIIQAGENLGKRVLGFIEGILNISDSLRYRWATDEHDGKKRHEARQRARRTGI